MPLFRVTSGLLFVFTAVFVIAVFSPFNVLSNTATAMPRLNRRSHRNCSCTQKEAAYWAEMIEQTPANRGDNRGTGSARQMLQGLARGLGGAILFALPLLMTMEMWWLGFYLSAWRLLLLTVVF